MSGPALLLALLLLPGAAWAAGPTPDTPAPAATPSPAPAPGLATQPPDAKSAPQPPDAKPAAQPDAKAAPSEPARREQVHANDAFGVLGRTVKDTKGDDIGRIVNVLIDSAGLPRAAVVEAGGFLGVGSRRIAIAWRALTFPPDKQGPATLDMTMDQIKAIPEYVDSSGSKPVTIATPPPSAPPAAQSH
jgi:hypothetical protein